MWLLAQFKTGLVAARPDELTSRSVSRSIAALVIVNICVTENRVVIRVFNIGFSSLFESDFQQAQGPLAGFLEEELIPLSYSAERRPPVGAMSLTRILASLAGLRQFPLRLQAKLAAGGIDVVALLASQRRGHVV